MGQGAYLCISVVLFALGLCCILARRNLIHVLMGVELVLLGANINFVVFARSGNLDGKVMALFVTLIAASEAAIGLAIVLLVLRTRRTIKPSALDRLRE